MIQPIPMYRGPGKTAEDNLTEGPEFDEWKSSILEYCKAYNISNSEDIITVAKNHLNRHSGIAYSICFIITSLKNETDHEAWFDHFKFLCEGIKDESCVLMNKLVALISLDRKHRESFNSFFAKLCKLHTEALLVAREKNMENAETVITTLAETNLFKNLPKEVTIASDWRNNHFRKALNHVNLEVDKLIKCLGESVLDKPTLGEIVKQSQISFSGIIPNSPTNDMLESLQNLQVKDYSSDEIENEIEDELTSDDEIKCSKCHKIGHIKEECYFVLDENGKRCLRCKKPGHSRAECKTLRYDTKETDDKNEVMNNQRDRYIKSELKGPNPYGRLSDGNSFVNITIEPKMFNGDIRLFLPATVNGKKLFSLMANCSGVNLIKESFLKEVGINYTRGSADLSEFYLFAGQTGKGLNVVGMIELTLHLSHKAYINAVFCVVNNLNLVSDGLLGNDIHRKYAAIVGNNSLVFQKAYRK